MNKKIIFSLILISVFLKQGLWGQLVEREYLGAMDEIYVSSVMNPNEIRGSYFSHGLSNNKISEIVVQNLRANGVNAKIATSVYNTPLLRVRSGYSDDYGLVVIDMHIHGNIGSKRAVLWYTSPVVEHVENQTQVQTISKIIKNVRLQTQWLIDDWRKEH